MEHPGGRYIEGGVYCGNFLNAGVTFWDIAASRPLRQDVIQRGRTAFRNNVDDQLALNEIVYAHYLDKLTLLPSVYNYRAYIGRKVLGWPKSSNLDGVFIYHHDECLKAKSMPRPKPNPPLAALEPDPGPISPRVQFWRKLRQRLKPHLIR